MLKKIQTILGCLFVCTKLCSQIEPDTLLPDKHPTPIILDSIVKNNDTTSFKYSYKHGLKYVLKTKSGQVFIGFIVGETTDFLNVENRTLRESYELRKSEIASIKLFSDRKSYEADVLGENYHAQNYLLASSAFLFDEGKVNSHNHWFLLENLDYAFTKNWAVAVNSLAFYPISIGVKFAYRLGDMNYLGGNVFGFGNIWPNNTSAALWGYGVSGKFTRGTSNRNFTIATGLLGLNSDVFYKQSKLPYANVLFSNASYCSRISQRVSLNIEAWWFPKRQTGFCGLGFKFVKYNNSCWSFGSYGILNNFNNKVTLNLKAIPIPYFGITQKL
jgi:hypothetical protein